MVRTILGMNLSDKLPSFRAFCCELSPLLARNTAILAIVYPIVISYYNVLVFHKLMQLRNIRVTALAMIGIGWIATSAANAIALEHQLWIALSVLGLFSLLYPFYFRRIS
jgi:hypothetical protein